MLQAGKRPENVLDATVSIRQFLTRWKHDDNGVAVNVEGAGVDDGVGIHRLLFQSPALLLQVGVNFGKVSLGDGVHALRLHLHHSLPLRVCILLIISLSAGGVNNCALGIWMARDPSWIGLPVK